MKKINEVAQARTLQNKSKNEQLKKFITLLEKVCEKLNLPLKGNIANESFNLSKEIDKRRIANYLTQGMSFKLLDNLTNQNFENVIEKLTPNLHEIYQKYFGTLLKYYRNMSDDDIKELCNMYVNMVNDEKVTPKNYTHNLNLSNKIKDLTRDLSNNNQYGDISEIHSIIDIVKRLEQKMFTAEELSKLCKDTLIEIFNPKGSNNRLNLINEIEYDIRVDYNLGGAKQGYTKVSYNPNKVIARGQSFIITLHEAIKGTCEFFASSDKGYTKEQLTEIYDITDNWFEEHRSFKYGYSIIEQFLYFFSNVEEKLMFDTNPKTNEPYISDYDFSMTLLFLEYTLNPKYIPTDVFLEIFNVIFEGEEHPDYQDVVNYGSKIYLKIINAYDKKTGAGNAPPPELNERYVKNFNSFINRI